MNRPAQTYFGYTQRSSHDPCRYHGELEASHRERDLRVYCWDEAGN